MTSISKRIPPATLTLTAPLGQQVSVKHQQFGEVALDADGRVDSSFTSRPGPEFKDWMELSTPGIREFMQQAADEISESKALSAQLEKFRLRADARVYLAVKDHSSPRLESVLKENKLSGSAGVDVGEFGDISQVTMRSSYGSSQRVDVTDSSATLRSLRNDGEHHIEVPIKDGVLDFQNASETLELKTPWLHSDSRASSASQAIHDLEDPRLERLAQAAEEGFRIRALDLGAGWSSEDRFDSQILKHGSQTVTLDHSDRSFTIGSSTWKSAQGGELLYIIKDAVRWQEGRMTRVKSE